MSSKGLKSLSVERSGFVPLFLAISRCFLALAFPVALPLFQSLPHLLVAAIQGT